MSEYIKREALRNRFDIPDRDYVIREMISRGLNHDAAEVAAEIVIESMRIVRNEISDFPAADVEPVVRTVGDLIKSIIRCNSIIALYEEHSEEDGRPLYEIWRGMEWEIPTEYSKRKFVRIFGSIPESIIKADTINIQVERSGSGED